MDRVEFTVAVLRLENGHVEVEVRLPDGDDFAVASASDLDTALRMAVSYMACAAESGPPW